MEFVKEIDGKKVKAVQAENGKLYLVWDSLPLKKQKINSSLNKRGATYEKSPCNKCGDVRRYVSNGHCPTCHNEKTRINTNG